MALSAGKFACTTEELSDIVRSTPASMLDKNQPPAVVPGIAKWQGGTGNLTLNAKSRIVIEPASAKALQPLADRLVTDLAEITGLTLKIVSDQPVREGDIALSLSPCNEAVKTKIGNEGYTLNIGKAAILRGNIAKGVRVDEDKKDYTDSVFYASRTLLQMLMLDGKTAKAHAELKQGYAVDVPLYKEREFLFDVSRLFADKDFLKAYLKYMGWYKINTLHLHLNDYVATYEPDPERVGKWATPIFFGFRLHSDNPNFAKFQPLSDDGLYYSSADWAELEDVAAENGVSLVPEFDAPGGHAQVFVNVMKRLYPGYGDKFDADNPKTLTYVKAVWDEFLPWFRSTKVHIGGDEGGHHVSGNAPNFAKDLSAYLKGKGRTVYMWNDMVQGSSDYDPATVVQYWLGDMWNSPAFKWINSSMDFYLVPYTPRGDMCPLSGGAPGEAFYAEDPAFVPYGPLGDKKVSWYENLNVLLNKGPVKYEPIGGQISIWNDLPYRRPYSYDYIHFLFRDVVPSAGQIWWNGQKKDDNSKLLPYSTLRPSIAKLQYGPGVKNVSMFKELPLTDVHPDFSKRPDYRLRPVYLAQDAVLAGIAAKKNDCASCDGGSVGGLGKDGAITFTISVETTGTYMLPIQFVSAKQRDRTQTAQTKINNTQFVTITFPPSMPGPVIPMAAFVSLTKGTNTIELSNPDGPMPDIAGLGKPLLQPAPTNPNPVSKPTLPTNPVTPVAPKCVASKGKTCPPA